MSAWLRQRALKFLSGSQKTERNLSVFAAVVKWTCKHVHLTRCSRILQVFRQSRRVRFATARYMIFSRLHTPCPLPPAAVFHIRHKYILYTSHELMVYNFGLHIGCFYDNQSSKPKFEAIVSYRQFSLPPSEPSWESRIWV